MTHPGGFFLSDSSWVVFFFFPPPSARFPLPFLSANQPPPSLLKKIKIKKKGREKKMYSQGFPNARPRPGAKRAPFICSPS